MLGLSLPAVIGILFPILAPTLRTEIAVAPGTAPSTTTIQVRLEPSDFVLGSYQGRLTFPPKTLSIVSVAAPSGDGGTHMLNAADSAKGVIRFAGYTVAGFTGKSVVTLTLTVRSARPIDSASLEAVVDVAGDLEGRALPKDRLIPAHGSARR